MEAFHSPRIFPNQVRDDFSRREKMELKINNNGGLDIYF
jgi:hypothetical protein